MTGAHGRPLSVAETGNDLALYGGVPVAYRAGRACRWREGISGLDENEEARHAPGFFY
ncbi:hypothetical protein ALP99_101518 [Pseudomonas syringae pv. tomato]|uniref:Uncharacterized protein n=3 Tax=Pseudomonas syringae group TaxID=136849 RepID=A0A3M3MDE7_9PSED|nr:hypothetical protein ALO36_102435 [Pseudomonas syringae pv. tomato]KPZ09210.1 hypothetical protein ALO40_101663 [Pseudomonas syringae pv. viburni]RMN45546.1 hypothetical protein ALQ58_101455 [Pseudomonas syringae pv. apii]RMO82571.1 hypothetical protein ALQ34_102174 [Pseudomonas syringae pv. maculicola]RMO92101.1 hypothetical protein ALQ32_101342 [Pseudomonas syringae pv. tagetis]